MTSISFRTARLSIVVAAALGALLFAPAPPAEAGGALETFDITGLEPSPFPGFVLARPVGIRWDSRCVPVGYDMNDTLDPIPNPLGADFLTLADAQASLQASLDAWNEIPTSFIDMQITGTTSNPGTRGFDMVNELTFRTSPGFGAIASAPSVSLISDVSLADGQDIDGDGDGDVSAAIATCQDVDGDGDVELPAGAYEAGTILDNDVQFNTNLFRFTILDSQVDTVSLSVDLRTVAVHEFGHSHGLSHTLNNQIGSANGTGATMFPFIDTGDPASELAQRILDTDDAAWSSYFYPEGSSSSGPGSLGPGDVAFDSVYGLIRGQVTHGVFGVPAVGTSVSARLRSTGELQATGFAGHATLAFRLSDGALFFNPDPATALVDGDYVVPVPFGMYEVGIEQVGGLDEPVAANRINFTTLIGNFFGLQDFNEEFWNGDAEGALEVKPYKATPVNVNAGGASSSGIDVVTNDQVEIGNFGSRNFIGFTLGPPGLIYAVRIPGAEIQAATGGAEFLVHAAQYYTTVVDASVVPVFAVAALATGVDNGDGTATVDLADPLEVVPGFVGQDGDFAPFYFFNPVRLGQEIKKGLDQGEIDSLFLVLQVPPAPWPGVSARAPAIGLDGNPGGPNDVPIANTSFISVDGGATFVLDPRFNFQFELVLGAKP